MSADAKGGESDPSGERGEGAVSRAEELRAEIEQTNPGYRSSSNEYRLLANVESPALPRFACTDRGTHAERWLNVPGRHAEQLILGTEGNYDATAAGWSNADLEDFRGEQRERLRARCPDCRRVYVVRDYFTVWATYCEARAKHPELPKWLDLSRMKL